MAAAFAFPWRPALSVSSLTLVVGANCGMTTASASPLRSAQPRQGLVKAMHTKEALVKMYEPWSPRSPSNTRLSAIVERYPYYPLRGWTAHVVLSRSPFPSTVESLSA